ncbi:MAG: lipopolysaccharide biosynthesis protein [Holosporaceae bacterium]|jgi:O-antigen/teichoic acid export membrane protein
MQRFAHRFTPLFQVVSHGLQHRGYMKALSSSYLLMLISILAQVIFVPLYLQHYGQYQFGVLMVLLSLVNFAVIGIAWMSGGSLRLLSEYASLGQDADFKRAFGLIKAIYTGYGIGLGAAILFAVSFFGQLLFRGGNDFDLQQSNLTTMIMACYLMFFFPAALDRLALTARKRQGAANMAQISGVIASSVSIYLWITHGGGMAGVMGFQIVGAVVSLVITRILLNQEVSGLRLCFNFRQNRDVFRRLGGKTGAGFFLHGALVLALLADTALVGFLGGAKIAAEFYLVWKVAEVMVQLIWKLPEPMVPYFVQMDVRGDHTALSRIAQRGYALVAGISLLSGIFYAWLGPAVVSIWVGHENVPNARLGFALAGGAIFWLGISRLPVVLASARVTLRQLNWVGGMELLGKVGVTVILFPQLGYVSVLLAINLVHLLGVSFLYFRLLPRHDALAKP